MMRSLRIEDVRGVVGPRLSNHRAYSATAPSSACGWHVRTDQYCRIAHSRSAASTHIDQPFLLFWANIFFVARDSRQMRRLLAEQGGGAVSPPS